MDEKVFLNKFKTSLENGNPVLIEDFGDALEPILDPIINKSWYVDRINQRVLIKFNDETIDYDENFKIYLCSKKSNPKFLPDVFIRTNVINFTVTKKGLEDQLLGLVVKMERPEIEEQMNDLIEKCASYVKTLANLEKKILKQLGESTKSPVEDEGLVNTLQESKEISTEVKIKFKESEETTKTINTVREQYREVAKIGNPVQ